MTDFKVIDGDLGRAIESEKPKATQWVCGYCDGSVVVPAIMAPRVRNGEVVAGTDRYICAHCFADGKITIVS